jgi:hypothetical protein
MKAGHARFGYSVADLRHGLGDGVGGLNACQFGILRGGF